MDAFMMMIKVFILALLMAGTAKAEVAEPGNPARGRSIAEANCATCHAIGLTGASPYLRAPPFRTLHTRYPVEGLAEALAEGISVGHTGERQMPEFVLSPEEIDDFLSFLKTLEKS
jgi:cytochrome c